MYRRDLRNTDHDDLLASAAVADAVVQAAPGPDGERVAYAAAREGQTDLWLWDGQHDTRLTSEGVTALRYGRGDPAWFDWHPEGEEIAFVDAEGSLSTVAVESGRVERLTNYDDPDLGLAYGPDGDRIAVVTDHFSRGSLAVVAADGSGVVALADDDHLYQDPRWGDDGAVYAVRAHHRDLFDYESALVRVPADGGVAGGSDPEVLFHEEGVRVQNVRPSPTDDSVAFVHDGHGFDGLYLTDADGSEPTTVFTREEAEVADPAWDEDGERLAVTVTDDAATSVWTVSRDGDDESSERLTEEDAFHTAPRWRDGEVLVTRDTPHEPPSVQNVSTGEQVTPRAAATGFAERVPTPETITYESAGREIQAVVYPPADAERESGSVPLLVKAHGGPTSFDRFRFDYRAGYFAALGYCVILPNYRGSDAYGREFRMANDHDWGGGDLDDVIAAADAAADAYDAVDGDRAGIYGGSGGGLMTVNALGNSDRFRAGAAFYGVYDYETFVDDTDDIGWQLMKRELGDLATDTDNYRAASPIRTVPDIEDPLLVLHGEDDARVPISQSEQLVAELEKHGKSYEFRRYDGEPHGFGGRENVLDAYTRVADLFAKYLQIDPDEGSSSPHPTDEPDRTAN